MQLGPTHSPLYAPCLSGMIARSKSFEAEYLLPTCQDAHFLASPVLTLIEGVAASIISPIELVRTRMQSSEGPRTVREELSRLSGMVRTSGFNSLWRGLGSTLWRDVPFSGTGVR
jgi:solute carrier family 25 protein 39/40